MTNSNLQEIRYSGFYALKNVFPKCINLLVENYLFSNI